MKKETPAAPTEPIAETSAAELDMMARVDASIAVPEGDDIQDAVDTLAASGGGTVVLGPGVHSIAAPIVVPANVSIVGAPALHTLDVASVNSKIVVVKAGDPAAPQRLAVLMTPSGEQLLSADDPAHKLPEGARIVKKADGKFVAMQLSPADDRPDLETTTAADAIARFNQHFHDVKP